MMPMTCYIKQCAPPKFDRRQITCLNEAVEHSPPDPQLSSCLLDGVAQLPGSVDGVGHGSRISAARGVLRRRYEGPVAHANDPAEFTE